MMRSFLKWTLGTVALTVMFVLAIPAQKAQAQNDYVSYQTFYDDLAPYGQWVNDPEYGNVWVPDVGNDFRPYYTRGYWVATNYGNTWVSDYPWGWAAFHYGRWTYNPFYGWVWIPGNTWGPAWVNWRTGGGYYGWAPLGPGVSISMSFGNYSCPNDWWVFMGPQYLYNRNFHNYWRGPRYNTTIINQTTIINNTYNNTYVYGPRPNDIERVTNQRVNVHRISNGGDRGRTVVNNNTVNIYRPQVRGNATSESPRNVVRAPRAVGNPESVRSGKPEFKSMVQRGDVTPVRANTGGRQDRFDSPNDQVDRTNNVRPTPGRIDRQNIGRQPVERQEPQRVERPQIDRGQQRIDRQQIDRGQQERIERAQQQQRFERPQQQRMERPQVQQQQRFERPQQQRMERPQMQQQQRMERPQIQRQQPQRMERPQMQRQQPQRVERQQIQRQQPQHMERSQPSIQRQSAPAPRPQPQGRPDMGNRGGGRR